MMFGHMVFICVSLMTSILNSTVYNAVSANTARTTCLCEHNTILNRQVSGMVKATERESVEKYHKGSVSVKC